MISIMHSKIYLGDWRVCSFMVGKVFKTLLVLTGRITEGASCVAIYTRGGDQGQTQVVGSRRRFKDDARVQALGTIDEAGALLGAVVSFLSDDAQNADVVGLITEIQQTMWDVGADLARVHDAHPYRTPANAAANLEPQIDRYQAVLPSLHKFIVRGGSIAGAHLHLACTVVRRAEREVVHLQHVESIHPPALQYLNRLSDLLFVLARLVNYRAGISEVTYQHSAHVFH